MKNNLENIRKNLKLNKKQMAEKLDIIYTTYVGYETGKREPNSETLIKMSRILNVSIDYILGATNTRKTEYTEETPTTLTPEEQSIIDVYRQLKPSTKEDLKKYLNYRLVDDQLAAKAKPKTQFDSVFDLKIAARSGKSEVRHLTKEEAMKLQEYLDSKNK